MFIPSNKFNKVFNNIDLIYQIFQVKFIKGLKLWNLRRS